jgi:hypothetical protein
LKVYLSTYLWLYSPCGPWPLFQLLNLYTVGRTPWTGDQPVAKPLPTHTTTQTHNKRTQTYMPRVGFEPTIPAFVQEKTVHALDRAVTVIGTFENHQIIHFHHTTGNKITILEISLNTHRDFASVKFPTQVATCLQICLNSILIYSKPSLIRLQLIRMSDNPDRKMKNEQFCSQLSTYFKKTRGI